MDMKLIEELEEIFINPAIEIMDVTLKADTFENMEAAFFKKGNKNAWKTHMKAVVSGQIKESKPTDSNPDNNITLAEEKVFFMGWDESRYFGNPKKAIEGDKTYRISVNVISRRDRRNVPVMLNGEMVILLAEEAYRHGLRMHENTNASVKTGKSVITKMYEEKTKEAKEKTSFLGACELSGSEKQINWAEQIRADKLESMSDIHAEIAIHPEGLAKTARFWIDNRTKTSEEIGERLERTRVGKRIIKQHKQNKK